MALLGQVQTGPMGGTGLMGSVLGGFMAGQQQKRNRMTQQLAPQAMLGDPQAMQQLGSVNPDAAMQIQGMLDQQKQHQVQQDQFAQQQAVQQARMALEERRLEQDLRLSEMKYSNEQKKADENRLKQEMDASKDKFEQEGKLRKEVSAIDKPFRTAQDSMQRIEAIPDTAAGDLAMIFNFMKVNDPGSVVRESEFATAESAMGWFDTEEGKKAPAKARQAMERLATGKRLTPKQRKDFINTAKSMFKSQERLNKQRMKPYESAISEYNLSRENIFQPVEEVVEAADVTQLSNEDLLKQLGQ